jgi:hypothetical protein
MVFRAHFFFELWEKFLDVGGYPKSKHYVSTQCADILQTLVQGFLQLVIIHRDYCGRQPFLPWLFSTEVIEHIFGMCRQMTKDFTMLDFLYMVPKLSIRLREAFFSSRTTDGKARASGYAHSHTDTRGIDLAALSTYPSNEEIEEAANQGYQEAHSLFAYLGTTATQIYRPGIATLPGINAWFMGDDDDGEDEDPLAETDGDASDKDREYQLLLDDLEDVAPDTRRGETLLSDFRHASIALSDEDVCYASIDCSIVELD